MINPGLNRECAPHQIPFRTILTEYARRRPRHLEKVVAKQLDQQTLEDALARSEKAYANLDNLKSVADSHEAAQIHRSASGNREITGAEEECKAADAPLKAILHAMDGHALCLSGGGIRSASFNLGILEGLARYSTSTAGSKPSLMNRLDYLSTVSGGGYIGSWLMAWIYRSGNDAKGYHEVIQSLAGNSAETSGDPEPRTVRNLREYSSFFAPKLGLSLDTWQLVAIVLRNLIVNWMLFIPVLFAAVAIPQAIHFFMLFWASAGSTVSNVGCAASSVLAGALFFYAGTTAARRLPLEEPKAPSADTARPILLHFVLPVCGASFFLNLAYLCYTSYAFSLLHVIAFEAVGLAGFYPIMSRYLKKYSRKGIGGKAIVIPVILIVTFIAVALEALAVGTSGFFDGTRGEKLVVVFGVPIVASVAMLASGMLSGMLGLIEDEEVREWWARAGGAIIASLAGWMIAEAIVIYGSEWLADINHVLWSAAGALVTGALGAGGGFSGKTTGTGDRTVKSSQAGAIGKFLDQYHLILPAISAAALLFIALVMVRVEEDSRTALQNFAHLRDLPGCLIVIGVAAGFIALFNRTINVNVFSLHGMYRLRLMRAFLGASNTTRNPFPFINFDPKDTPHEKDLPATEGVPLHVINGTLNLVGTKNLAWQQRKGESFTFTPISCGSWRIGYVPTAEYAGRDGVTLATAMAISGAAVNPNMGYYSSPLVTVLMTLANARLGWWLPNVRQSAHAPIKKPGPDRALGPFIQEAFSGTNDESKWIEVTDGGHFENFGLYEMILRRCRSIIVVDVGADPEYQFEDLGNALRKIQIDLGVPIRFKGALPMHKAPESTNLYCAVAEIDYSCVDGLDVLPGKLVYIKSVLCGDEPPDIFQYKSTHPDFPNETTANQFYTESQFESYRHLGSFVVDQIIAKGKDPSMPDECDMGNFQDLAAKYSAPASKRN